MDNTSCNAPPTLLQLPGEIRQRIWTLVVPSGSLIYVKLCKDRTLESGATKPISPLAAMLRQRALVERLHRDLGLHIRLVNQQVRQESHQLLARKTFHFCCLRCYAEFLKSLRDRGIGVLWMKTVEVSIDLQNDLQKLGYHRWMIGGPMHVSTKILTDMMQRALQAARELTLRSYGRLDLLGRESWTIKGSIASDCHQYRIAGVFDT